MNSRISYLQRLAVVLALALDKAGAFQANIGSNNCRGGIYSTTPTSLPAVPLDEMLQLTSDTATAISSTAAPSSTIMLAEETWRQYVPLAVSVFVIIDILLGSPLANSVLGVVRSSSDDKDNEDNNGTPDKPKIVVKTKGERVDSSEVANAALERARTALAWKTEKEKWITDADRMEEMRKKMDDQLRAFDEKERGKSKQ